MEGGGESMLGRMLSRPETGSERNMKWGTSCQIKAQGAPREGRET